MKKTLAAEVPAHIEESARVAQPAGRGAPTSARAGDGDSDGADAGPMPGSTERSGFLMRKAHMLGESVLSSVDKAVETRWEAAIRAADSTSGSHEERIATLKRSFAREMTMLGAAAGAAAAVPGAGAVAFVGGSAIELSLFTARAADLILSIAAVHGITEASVEERRAWLLSVLAFGDGAAAAFTRVAGEAGRGLGARAVNAIPVEVLRRINRSLGRTVLTKYGTKRGAIALGRALPFGFGAVIGGGSNYVLARTIARQADSFFALVGPLRSSESLDPT